MKLIKSIFALAAVVFLGMSAQGYTVTTNDTARNITMTLGEKITYQGPHKAAGDRWWSFSASSTYNSSSYATDLANALKYVQPSFVNALEGEPLVSNGAFNDPELTFEALQVTQGSVSFYIYGAQDQQGSVPSFMPNRPYGGQTIWSASNLDPLRFNITVVALPLVSVEPQCEDHTTAKVYTNGVEVTGNPVKVVTNATVDVVFTAEKGWFFDDFSTVKTNTVTATDDPTKVAGESVIEGQPVGENAYLFMKDGVGTIVGEGDATKLPSGFDLDSITSVVVADGITEIDARFFKKCRKLNTVTLGKNVAKVGENAFYLCRALEKITVENPNFDLEKSGLMGAIVYQAAIDSVTGKLYTIPSISIPGYKEVLYGTNDLEDKGSWTVIQPDTTMEKSGYHFFKYVLEKIVD